MQRQEKPLPQPPQGSGYIPAKPPQSSSNLLAEQSGTFTHEQSTKLKQQNESLQHAIRKKNEELAQLRQKIAHYQRYVKQQHESFTRVFRKISSVFEEYQATVEDANASAIEVDSVDEAIQAYAAFSDSEEDFI